MNNVPTFQDFNTSDKNDKTLVILRGLPGAGKSTFAELLSRGNNQCICCADDFFTDENGNYNFDMTKIKSAHQWCQNKCRSLMATGANLIIVSNTGTTENEINVYLNLAKEFGYRVTSLIVENRHGNKSIHNVPDRAIENMRNRFQISL